MKKVITLGFVLGTTLLQACASQPEPDYDAMYLARFNAVKENGGMMPAYTPMVEVKGVKHHTPLPKVSPANSKIRKSALDKAESYAAANKSDAFIVWKDGNIEREAYFGDVSANTQLVSKSLSKPLGAIAIGRAIQMGKITSIEQPVAELITEWQGTPKAEIKIKHLLNMTSGFLPQGYSVDPQHLWNKAYLSPQHEKILINDYPLVSKPGTVFGYNNATADMIALVIERATGTRYETFVSEEILKPLGAAGGEIWVNRIGGLAHSGCCMTLPAETWLRLAILLLNDGVIANEQLLPEGYVALMTTPSAYNEHYGLGVWVGSPYTKRRGFTGPNGPGPQVLHSAPYPDPALFLFDGNSNQVVYISPTYNTVILRLGKTPPKQPEWDNSVLPNLVLKGIK